MEERIHNKGMGSVVKDIIAIPSGEIEFVLFKKKFPVYIFIIKTTQGNILFDSGFSSTIFSDSYNPEQYLGSAHKFANINLSDDQKAIHMLKRHNIETGNIGTVVLSHLHFDHAGGILDFQEFNKEKIFVHELEYEEIYSTYTMFGDYGKSILSFVKNVRKINGDRYDLFGNGEVTLLHTPGHTKGHISLLYKSCKTGDNYLFLGDVSYTVEDFLNNNYSGSVYRKTARDTFDKIRKIIIDEQVKYVLTSHSLGTCEV
ncbi:MBL fold metallo-hydrolase [Paenibacillus albiflavus]|uniref:MBL fold metallo-hydrolase n=1 Tax=Paenibacillus albiflavus TaxID=2545760 RepID=A0A4R4EBA7_9BACL|nr:MBL fold metallo-hydrolase [Paenibacillus albiflavus]TCZ77164.1 MBL fold metallo-hydrolase [Paenibacillus albiflavus]